MKYYDAPRKEYYQELIVGMSEQLAELLDNGKTVEIGRSRSGLKLFAYNRTHEQIRKPIAKSTPGK